jgi:hypothetical protein
MDQFDYEPEYPEEPINYPNNEPIVLIDYYQKLIKYFDNYLSYLPEDINPLELDKYDRDNYHIYNMDIGELKTLIEVEKQKLKNYTFIKPQPPQNKELPNQISYSKELINYYEKLIRRCDIILSNDTLSEFDHLYAYCRDDYKDKLESAIHRYIRNYRMYVEDQDNKLYNIYEKIPNSDYNSDEYRSWNIKFLARQSALFQYQEYRDRGPLPIEIEQEEWKDAVISRNPDPDYNLIISFESNEGWSPDKEKKYFIYLKSEESDITLGQFHSSKTLIIEYLSGNWYIISGEITNFPIGRSTNIVAYPVEYYILKMNEAFKNLLKKFKSDKDNKIEDYGLEPYLKDFQESILNNPIELDRALESLKEKSSKNYLNKYKKYPNEDKDVNNTNRNYKSLYLKYTIENKDVNNTNRNYKSLYLKYKKKYLNLKYSSNKDHMIHSKNYPSNS